MSTSTSELFTSTTIFSLLGVVAILVAAYAASALLLSKSARAVDRYIFIWLAFDALIHFIFEGSFLYYSTFGRTVFRGSGPFAELCKNPLFQPLTLHSGKNMGDVCPQLLFLFFLFYFIQGRSMPKLMSVGVWLTQLLFHSNFSLSLELARCVSS
jgi:hypothetical protein